MDDMESTLWDTKWSNSIDCLTLMGTENSYKSPSVLAGQPKPQKKQREGWQDPETWAFYPWLCNLPNVVGKTAWIWAHKYFSPGATTVIKPQTSSNPYLRFSLKHKIPLGSYPHVKHNIKSRFYTLRHKSKKKPHKLVLVRSIEAWFFDLR